MLLKGYCTLNHEIFYDSVKCCSLEAEWNSVFFAFPCAELKEFVNLIKNLQSYFAVIANTSLYYLHHLC